MAVQIITDNDSIYDYWYEDGQLYGRRKSNKIPFKINSDKANSIIFPQVQAKGVENQHLPQYTTLQNIKKCPLLKKYLLLNRKKKQCGKQLIGNGLSRKLQLFFDLEPEHTSKRIKIPNKKEERKFRNRNISKQLYYK